MAYFNGKEILFSPKIHIVTEFATAKVNVPIPEISGRIEITENGTHNVKDYAEAVVNVDGGGTDEQWNRFVIPRGIGYIPDSFAEENEYIETVLLADDVKKIGNYAFSSCIALSSVNMPNSLRTIGALAFDSTNLKGVLVFPSSLESIGIRGFGFCGLTELIFEGTPNNIDGRAFEGCYDITAIYFRCSEDEAPAGAPWGAENAEIIYDWE